MNLRPAWDYRMTSQEKRMMETIKARKRLRMEDGKGGEGKGRGLGRRKGRSLRRR